MKRRGVGAGLMAGRFVCFIGGGLVCPIVSERCVLGGIFGLNVGLKNCVNSALFCNSKCPAWSCFR